MSAVKLTPAQRQILALADKGRIERSVTSPTRWYERSTFLGRPYAVTATVESLIRRGLLETGEFAGLGVPRLAVVTAAGRALLDFNPETKGQP